ncbi:MAG: putative sulfate exporter family transporter [Pseudomonadota bacterium]
MRTSAWQLSIFIYLPGLALCAVLAAMAMASEYWSGAPVMLVALVLGMIARPGLIAPVTQKGTQMAAKRLLRLGIALLGARITWQDILGLGLTPIVLVCIAVPGTVLIGWGLAKILKQPKTFGLLTGGAVAICGASAALAFAAVLPAGKRHERDTLFTVLAVSALSTVAMIVYPALLRALGFDDPLIGILLGATIHDVAQVVGAGYSVSPQVGDIATYVKLLRVSLLPIAIIATALIYRPPGGTAAVKIPWFAVAFVLIMIGNSLGMIPAPAQSLMIVASQGLLVTAIVALGGKTSLREMSSLGAGGIILVVGETLALLLAAIVFIRFVS